MGVKSVAKGLLFLNLMAFAATAAIVWLLDYRAITDILDAATYAGLGMGGLGAMMFIGSTSRSSASTGMAASAADQPSRMMDALWSDRAFGISTGALFVLSGVSWTAMAWLLAEIAWAYQG
ncbi:hypothetical protein AB4Y85_09395 [Microvirga sp. 2YAF29]|uniref:hypothetical protein n=1 Tax=Microvirga sp. 2YAF29 TaxID=3233031 RepID=UPI003F9C4C20